MAAVLHFSSWGLAFDIAALFRFSEPGRSLFIANGLHIDGAELTFVIDGLAVFINRLAINCRFTADGIPLGTTGILEDLIIATRCCKSGGVIELGAGTILMTDLEVSILTMLSIHLRYRQIVAGHEVLECRLIISSCSITGLELRNAAVLLHGVPIHAVRRLHDRMGSIRLLEVGAVVPKGIAAIGRACFDNTIAYRAQRCSLRRTGEGSGNQRGLGVYTVVFFTSIVTIAIMSALCYTLEVAAVTIGHLTSTSESAAKVLFFCAVLMECATGRLFTNTMNTFACSGDHSRTGDAEFIRRRCSELRYFAGSIQHSSGRHYAAIAGSNSGYLLIFSGRECCHAGMSIHTVASKNGSIVNSTRNRAFLGYSGERYHTGRIVGTISTEDSSFLNAFCRRHALRDSGECNHSGRHVHAISGKGCTLLNSFGVRHTFCRSRECNHAGYIHTISCKNSTFLFAANSTTICSGEGNNVRLTICCIASEYSSFQCRCARHAAILRCSGISRHTGMTIHIFMGEGFTNRLAVFSSMRYTRIIANNRICIAGSMGNICPCAVKDRCIIEDTTTLPAGHLIPLTSVCSCDNTVGNIRLLILSSVEHIHRGLFAICANRCGADMSTGNLGALQLESLHMGHVVAQAAICDLTTDSTGHIGRSGSYGRDGIAVEGSTISCGNATKGSAHKSGATAEAHPLTTFHNGITNITVGAESGCKTSCKTICCSTGSSCHSTTTCTTEYIARRSGATAYTGNDPGSHHQLHTHAGTSLGHIKAHGCKVAIKPLSTFEVCQCTEHPEEDAAFSRRQGTAICDELPHRRSKATKEPDIHDQEQQLRANHSAPGSEYGIRGLGSA